MMKFAVIFLAISQLSLVLLHLKIMRSISELEYRSHWHTFWYKDGEKVNETISSYSYMETNHG